MLTLVFYALALAGLWLHRRRQPVCGIAAEVDKRELALVGKLFGLLIALALVLSFATGTPVLFVPIVLNFVLWSLLGVVLTVAAWFAGLRQPTVSPPADSLRV